MDERTIPWHRRRGRRSSHRWLTGRPRASTSALVKYHSICGYTGAMKNMMTRLLRQPPIPVPTTNHASPQIAPCCTRRTSSRAAFASTSRTYVHVCRTAGPPVSAPSTTNTSRSCLDRSLSPSTRSAGRVIDKQRVEAKLVFGEVGLEPYYIKIGRDPGLRHRRPRPHPAQRVHRLSYQLAAPA